MEAETFLDAGIGKGGKKLSEKTLYEYRKQFESRILPIWGDYPMTELPTDAIMEPAILDHLRLSKASTSGTWLGAPPTLEDVQLLSTSSCSSGDAVIGDFAQSAWCIRDGLRIETSTQAGDSFANHQIWLKVWSRWDYSVLNTAAFRRMAGITTGA